jgi:hypothetical protein
MIASSLRTTCGGGKQIVAHRTLLDPWRRFALAKLGYDVGKDAVAKYMPRPVGRTPRPPSQTWGTFIRTHAVGTIAIDFFTVPTVTFGVLYVFFVLALERRRVIHVNVTEHPTAEWAAQQIVEAVGLDGGLARLIRDRDKIFGAASTAASTTLV